MEVKYCRCCGIDVHKDRLTACVLILEADGKRTVRMKEFETHIRGLENLRLWLYASKVTQVAMESTGVYWKPVWNVLSGHFGLLLANPFHMHNIPGHKTDAADSEWIADLLAHGLLKPSFVPPVEIQDLRDWTRYRVKLTGERNQVHNRIGKVLEDTNLKLGSVVSDILGTTGRLIIDAVVKGQQDPGWLSDYARGKLRCKKEQLRKVLRQHHRELLKELMEDMRRVEEKIGRVEQKLAVLMEPYAEQVTRLMTIPGVDVLTAWTIVAELGVDMTKFPSSRHAASWAGLVPGSNESAGKRKGARTRHGNAWLRRGLCQSAWVVSRMKDCYLTAVFRRRARKGGTKKATIATAHQILVIAYCLLRDQSVYRELGGDYFDKLNPARAIKRITQRAAKLGYAIKLEALGIPLAPVAPKRPRGRPRKARPGLTDGIIGP
jgi:transposase